MLNVCCTLLQEARFDRHFVRDLTWSRHQLEELAKRRFIAAQKQRAQPVEGYTAEVDVVKGSFNDLFKKVSTTHVASVATYTCAVCR